MALDPETDRHVEGAADALVVLERRFASELPELALAWQASTVPEPSLVALNDSLADELGIDPAALRSPAGVAVLAGNQVPQGATPVALAYAGHQFGGYSPRLGDGRALLLGELRAASGDLVDVHLKGSGRTPFARGGDGKATVGPMLREFLIAEAMHALGIPTTRALAVVTTGETVMRTGPEPGAVLTRVAASHIRVGTFEFAARAGEDGLVKRLADHCIARHHPQAGESDQPYLALLAAVVEAQAELIARWMLVGFIHGVMNTDNMTISGEGIDYGPCAFMDRFDPSTVFSSIDHGGRYAYGNQPAVANWNLARLAETLLPLIADDPEAAIEPATEVLQSFSPRFEARWRDGMRAKLGLRDAPANPDVFDDLTKALEVDRVDFTGSFRRLSDHLRAGPDAPDGFTPALAEWVPRWTSLLDREGRDRAVVAAEMDAINPVYIPRNHLVDRTLDQATAGDLQPFRQLLDVVTKPFDARPGLEEFAEPAPDAFTDQFQTFCGT